MSDSISAFLYSPPRNLPTGFPQFPPFVINIYDFLNHFILFFVVPLASVVCSAIFAAALAQLIHRALFARYATPEELLEHALKELRKNGRMGNTDRRRKRALDTLRQVIKLQGRGSAPDGVRMANRGGIEVCRADLLKPYTALATELFYGEIIVNPGGAMQGQQRRRTSNNTALRRRHVRTSEQAQQEVTNSVSPTLLECQDTIKQGLSIDSKNESLLKLEREVKLFVHYDGAHTKMLHVGSFGWMTG